MKNILIGAFACCLVGVIVGSVAVLTFKIHVAVTGYAVEQVVKQECLK